jgi:hypothetical protein
MPRGDKSSYSDKQKRQAAHIEQSEEKHGAGKKTAQRIAWATVNKQTGGAARKRKTTKTSSAKARTSASS